MLRSSSRWVLAIALAWSCACHESALVLPPPTRLPSGWLLSPAGALVQVPELPLGIDVDPDGRFAAVLCCGTGPQSIELIDLRAARVVSSTPVRRGWLGIRFFDRGRQLVASGGNDNQILFFAHDAGVLRETGSLTLGPDWEHGGRIWPAGIAIDHGRGRAWIACREDHSIRVLDLGRRTIERTIDVGGVSYACAIAPDGGTVAASLWGDGQVVLLDATEGRPIDRIPVGQHPCSLTFDATGARLFVCNANENTVSVVSVARRAVIEVIATALAPDSPPGSTPNALAFDARQQRLYIADADLDCVAVIDVADAEASHALGFLPSGWYPTDLACTGDRLVIACGKGFGSAPNPEAADLSSFLQGGVEVLACPEAEDLAVATAAVYRNSRIGPAPTPLAFPLVRDGERAPAIEHVFYVLKENKTYDSMFGDLPGGNGEPRYCLYDETITPNQHALAREFVLLDNFYVDAEVSADGHNWSMGAYATDWVEKSWPTHYGGRGGTYDDEWLGDGIEKPASGYLWDLCRRGGVAFRNYGEYVRNPSRAGEPVRALSESLRPVTCPTFRGWDLRVRDLERLHAWEVELATFEREGGVPQLSLVYLPDDHGAGTARGYRTMRAMVAENDLALGRLVERISHSPCWPRSAIFVLEDDAQGGADHVDVHRSPALVISPFTRRHSVDHTPYSTASVLRTIELILGLPPMSQFDATATPMQACFTADPDLTPFRARDPQVPLGEMNPDGAPHQQECDRMDFAAPDRAPDRRYAEILWATMTGGPAPMPPPVRAAFVFPPADDR